MPFPPLFSKFFSRKTKTAFPHNSAAAQKKAAHFLYDFDRWYPNLKQHTAPSVIQPISPAEAEAMVAFYQTRYLHQERLTLRHIQTLHQLEKTLSCTVKKTSDPAGFFVRLSDRSPKDGNIVSQEKEQCIQSLTATLANKHPGDALIYLMDIQMQLLRCTTAEQMLHLLLSSERIFF